MTDSKWSNNQADRYRETWRVYRQTDTRTEMNINIPTHSHVIYALESENKNAGSKAERAEA